MLQFSIAISLALFPRISECRKTSWKYSNDILKQPLEGEKRADKKKKKPYRHTSDKNTSVEKPIFAKFFPDKIAQIYTNLGALSTTDRTA